MRGLGTICSRWMSVFESLRESITSTSSTRQKLENQIELLKEQIHTAEMTDEHLQSRLLAIEKEKAQRLKKQERV